MSIQLQPGGNVSLTAENPLLVELLVGFGWTTIASGAPGVELVPSAILCDSAGKAVSADSMVFFNQLSTPDDAVRYVTKGDQEQIEVNLGLIPDAVGKVVFVVYVDPDIRKPGSFSTVRNAYIRVAGRDDKDLVRFDLGRTDSTVTAMIFGELYRYKSAWKFRALGDGFTTGIDGVSRSFGLAL
jgi:tellurium resistance protein TerD